jgi:hypothetical protein
VENLINLLVKKQVIALSLLSTLLLNTTSILGEKREEGYDS